MRSLVVAAVCTLCALTPSPAHAAKGASLDEVRDQGVHYFKRGRHALALTTLTKAYAMDGGKRDFLTVFYRGRAASETHQLEVAFEMLSLARTLPAEKKAWQTKARAVLEGLHTQFGKVNLVAAANETNTKGRIFFEPQMRILSKVKRENFDKIRTRFRTTDITLPITVYLPYGDYRVNQAQFAVVEGQETETVEIILQKPISEATEVPWVWIGAGAGAAALGIGLYFLLNEPAPIYDDRVQVQLHSLMVP